MSILDAIGDTPVIEIEKLNPHRDKVRILAKLEGANPCGSVKDRIAKKMIEMGMASGALTPDKTVLEPTLGNTGIGLAMVCGVLGFKLTLCMPECVGLEQRSVIQTLGATIVLTSSEAGTEGAIQKAREMIEADPEAYFMPNQFENPYNFMAHFETTGPEIREQTKGGLAAFVVGMGTAGTLMGVSRYFKDKGDKVQMIGVSPVSGQHIPGLKNMWDSTPPGIYDPSWLDRVLYIKTEEAFEMTRSLAVSEGVFVGISSGAALWGAIQVAPDLPAGSTVLCILPDRGDRYLSAPPFASMSAESPP